MFMLKRAHGPGSKAAGQTQDLLPWLYWRDSSPAFMGQRDTKPHGLQPVDPQSAYTVIRILRLPRSRRSLLVALTGIVKDRLYLEAWAVFRRRGGRITIQPTSAHRSRSWDVIVREVMDGKKYSLEIIMVVQLFNEQNPTFFFQEVEILGCHISDVNGWQ
ncbi:hypothetical protein AVEN_270025-1 [Araneus ventricosus]|uniref:Uncharacterized protein n=1 Tax=Araneus ventricosus TaxID=182803 RepID=A0A4Y2H6G9_ARAVE|nr:hypothetical protein AVEN_270025-1 [Araneus ventricosus]